MGPPSCQRKQASRFGVDRIVTPESMTSPGRLVEVNCKAFHSKKFFIDKTLDFCLIFLIASRSLMIRKLGFPIALSSALHLTACAAPQPGRFTGPGDNRAFLEARYQCLKETEQPVSGGYFGRHGGGFSSAVAPSCGAFLTCLATKGYTTDPNGSLQAPPGAGIKCT